MCGIYGSFAVHKFMLLSRLNKSRGVKESSIDELTIAGAVYNIGHVQTPTSNSALKHPAINNDNMLWHNGIIKQSCMDEYSSIEYDGWDTMFLLQLINTYGLGALSNVDGSFACVYNKGDDVFIFRNEIAPLYIDRELNLSSIKEDGMTMLPANKVFYINDSRELVVAAEFKTLNNPYKL